MSVGYWIK